MRIWRYKPFKKELTLQHSRRGSLDFLSGALWKWRVESALEIAKNEKDCENPDEYEDQLLRMVRCPNPSNLTEQIGYD